MPFPARSPRRPSSGDAGPIFGIGRQVFVNCSGGREDRAPLLDDKGAVVGSVIDGAEVEIIAWVPRGTATRYLVRATRTDVSGWLGAASLRTTRMPRSPDAAKSPAAAVWIAPQPAHPPRKKKAPRQASPASAVRSKG